jgi:hypothetical protein
MKINLVRIFIGVLAVASVASRVNAKDAAKEVVVDGEHFTPRQITEPKLNDIVAYRFLAPKSWHDKGQISWNLFHATHPSRVALTVENPANAEAFYVHPAMMCGYMRPKRPGGLPEGSDSGDGLWLHPMQPVDALSYYIKQTRGPR